MTQVTLVVEDSSVEIKRLSCFQKELEQLGEANHRRLFRGLEDIAYRLVPSIKYPRQYADRSTIGFTFKQEHELLHRFRRRAQPYMNKLLGEWEAMFLARHYALPTRIMDWSPNALVALYFVCYQKPETDGAVWMATVHDDFEHKQSLDVIRLSEFASKRNGPFTCRYAFKRSDDRDKKGRRRITDEPVDSVKVIYPFINSPRIAAQNGHFTYHGNPDNALNEYTTVEKENFDIRNLKKWTVKREHKIQILRDLDRIGVNQHTIYTDLESLAKTLGNSEVLYNGTPCAAFDAEFETLKTAWRDPAKRIALIEKVHELSI